MLRRVTRFLISGLAAMMLSPGVVPLKAQEATVPRVIQFSGVLRDSAGQPLTGVQGVSFALYRDQEGGSPLWIETQNVAADEYGRFAVLLGAATADGVPIEMFSSGESRWLGVQAIQSRDRDGAVLPEQPRVLLVSVPYALKAADAETLGGLPASAFLLASNIVTERVKDSGGLTVAAVTDGPITAAVTAGTVGRIGKFINATDLGDSVLFEDANKIGLGTTTPSDRLHLVETEPGPVRVKIGSQSTEQFSTAGFTLRLDEAADVNSEWHFFAAKLSPGAATGPSSFQIRRRNSSQTEAVTPFQITASEGVSHVILQSGFQAGSQQFGNVGIGTQNPTEKLDVVGNLKVSGTIMGGIPTFTGLAIQDNGTSPNLIGGFTGNSATVGVFGATIGGGGRSANGETNRVTDIFGTVGGGADNQAGNNSGSFLDADFATVSGGKSNTASGDGATVGGGKFNTASGNQDTVSGGFGNSASGGGATVGGGDSNSATAGNSVIGGGFSNNVSGFSAFVGGGNSNTASGVDSTVGGGQSNSVTAGYSVIGGGDHNSVAANYSTISGGKDNFITAPEFSGGYSTIAGGWKNFTFGNTATTVGGGYDNRALGEYSTVAGGYSNNARAEANYSTIGGGYVNEIWDLYSTVSGGRFNSAAGQAATIGGGRGNTTHGVKTTIGGGGYIDDEDFNSGNSVTDDFGTIGGGGNNIAGNGVNPTTDHPFATVGGGGHNTASGQESTVSGGARNTASGYRATVPGGFWNTAGGPYSFAAGRRARANHNGSFVWADYTDAHFESTAPNEFNVRASGGVRIFTDSLETAGVTLLAGDSTWNSVSDRNAKENFAAVAGAEVLEKLNAMPVETWNYKGGAIRHMGPMAQDFYAAFGLGPDDKHISTVDADGVALAGVQALYRMVGRIVQEKDTQIQELTEQVRQLQESVQALQDRQALQSRLGVEVSRTVSGE